MARTKLEQHRRNLQRRILTNAARSFLQHGYSDTTIMQIAAECNLSTGSVVNLYETKEHLLGALVNHMLNKQFEVTEEILKDRQDDKLLYFAVETTLQLYIVEMDEGLREVYSMAYSLPVPSSIIQKTITKKWEGVFKEYHPEYKTKDFFKLEIATSGIMRGFMTIPCDIWFTMDQKIETCLDCMFKMYDIPKEKIKEVIEFINGYDFNAIARKTVDDMLSLLDNLPEEA